jgi:hypothetical protein
LPLQLIVAVNLTFAVAPLCNAATQVASVLRSETSHVEPEGGTYAGGATYPIVLFNAQLWIVSERFPDLDESATQSAVILTEAGLGALAGAVYKAASAPIAAIVPTVEFPFGRPLTAQLTLVSGCPALVTVERSWTVPPGKTEDIPEGFVATVTPMSLVIVRGALPLTELLA